MIFTSLLDDSVGGDTNGDEDATVADSGDWSGIYASGAASQVTLVNARVSYGSSGVQASQSVRAVVRDSVFSRNGSGIAVTVDRSGQNAGTSTIEVSGTSVHDSDYGGIDVWATGSPVGSGTQIPVPKVQNNTVTGSACEAIRVYGDALDPGLLRGNNGSGNHVEQIQLGGTAKQNLDVPLGGLPLGITHYYDGLTIAAGATMTVAAGAIIKSSYSALTINGTLVANGTVASPVIFTSLLDDSVGGDTNGDEDATVADSGDWSGIYASGAASQVTLVNARVSYGSSGVQASRVGACGGA